MNPDLVILDREGKPYTVRYEGGERDVAQRVPGGAPHVQDQCRVEEQGAMIARLQKQIEALPRAYRK